MLALKRSNEAWLAALRASGPERAAALDELRARLLRGLGYTLRDRLGSANHPLLEDAVQEALLKILAHLDTFQGRSHFLTWAQKIAVREALTMLRRKAWQDVALDDLQPPETDSNDWTPRALAAPHAHPERRAEQNEVMALVMRLIQEALTPRQRRALMAVAVQGMPLAEVARRMNTNRNALYKLLHDARRRLKAALEAQGLSPEDLLAAFQEAGEGD